MSTKIICNRNNNNCYHIVVIHSSSHKRKIIKKLGSFGIETHKLNTFDKLSYDYYKQHGAKVSNRVLQVLKFNIV